MRFRFFLIVVLLPFINSAQSSEIEKLKQRKLEIIDKIELLKDTLSIIEDEITSITAQKILNKENSIITYAKKGADIRSAARFSADKLYTMKERNPIEIIDKVDNYFMVSYGDVGGFMHDSFVERTPEIVEFEKAIADRNSLAEKERLLIIENEEKERMTHPDAMVRKYGISNVEKMKKGIFWTGMNKEMLIYAIGKPNKINKNVGEWGIHEQWVYPNQLYIYFEDGIVTSYQN